MPTVKALVSELRQAGQPINWIEADEDSTLERAVSTDDLAAALKDVAGAVSAYQWTTVNGHYILYPALQAWTATVSGIDITETPRLAAARGYVAAVRDRVHELHDLSGPPMKGDPASPVYEDPVSLDSSAPILKHLVELLGDDDRLVFTIERGASGARILHFERIPERTTRSA